MSSVVLYRAGSILSSVVLYRAAFLRNSSADSTDNLENCSGATLSSFVVTSRVSPPALQIFQRPPCLPYLSRYSGWFHFFLLRIYLLAFFSQQTSFSITIESKQSSLNAVHSKKSSCFSFEPCALNSNCYEILMLKVRLYGDFHPGLKFQLGIPSWKKLQLFEKFYPRLKVFQPELKCDSLE